MESQDLKKAGLKATLPRLRILQLLEKNPQQHMTAQFESAGLVLRHHFEGGLSVFELNEGYHHDHLVCIKCGKIVEFVDEIIERQQCTIAQQHHFEITEHYLYIYGICPQCQRQKRLK